MAVSYFVRMRVWGAQNANSRTSPRSQTRTEFVHPHPCSCPYLLRDEATFTQPGSS